MEPGIHCILQRESAVHQRPPSKFRSTPLDIAMKTKADHNANSQTYGAEQLLQVGHTLARIPLVTAAYAGLGELSTGHP